MSALEVSGPDVSGVTTLTLNVPERRNAISDTMREEIVEICQAIDGGDDTKVVILTGAGPAFCAGGDLKAMSGRIARGTGYSAAYSNYAFRAARAAAALANLTRPVIVAVNGPAVGAGLSMAALGDLRIASTKASFSAPFLRRGLIPDWGLIHSLPRLIGEGPTTDMLLTGRVLNAQEALDLGLVGEVTEPETLMERARDCAQTVAEMAPLAVQSYLRLLKVTRGDSFGETLDREAVEQARLQQSKDYHEGVAAFMARRSPVFMGH